jgi:glutamate-5-semialdehyde dehydrogenase
MRDPIGSVSYATELDDGLELYRVSCPLGVVCVIFEARPDAAVQIATLGIKSANAVILKGGAEAARSNAAFVAAMRAAISTVTLDDAQFPVDSINLVEGRAAVAELMSMNEHIDLIIPRGSNELVQHIQRSTSIPVMGHADGICHIYVDATAELETAVAVVVDGKTQYPAVCNATETLLVHRDAAPALLPSIGAALLAKGVTLHCDPEARLIMAAAAGGHEQQVLAAQPDAFDTEWLSLDLSVKVVDSAQAAVEHVNKHGSGHTDVIITQESAAAEHFLANVDSATVGHNASTRFADGFRYGFGAEVGVSTNKTHARGPVGLEGLTIYKYKLLGRATADGRKHVVAQYSGGDDSRRKFTHTPIPVEAQDPKVN